MLESSASADASDGFGLIAAAAEESGAATDATDADTGAVTRAYVMSAPAGQSVVSPLTTLTHRKVKAEGKSLAQAEQEVKTNLGLAAGVSVFENYVAHRDSDDGYKKASVLARAVVRNAGTLMLNPLLFAVTLTPFAVNALFSPMASLLARAVTSHAG